MTWATAKGFNFRATSTYVTDGTNETYVLPGTSYPTTRTVGGESVTFGWETAPDDSRDRNTAIVTLAGMNFRNAGGSEDVFRVDLPSAGDYRIRIAAGDRDNPQGYYFDVRDTTTTLFTVGSATTGHSGGKNFADATGVEHYTANYVANNATVDDTFSTSIFRFALRPMTSLTNCIAHIQIEQLSAAASGNPWYYYAQQG